MAAHPPDPPQETPRGVATASRPTSRYLMTERGYLHPMKTYVWITLLVVGVMSLLYYVVGLGPDAQGSLPPSFGFGVSDLYFHSIAIGMAALAVYLVFLAFDLDRYEPGIDFPIPYRALVATLIGAIGAAFYLRPIFNTELAPIPLGLILVGLIFLADVGGALLVQLYLLPGKISGRYDPHENRLGMIPRWRTLPSWGDFRQMDSTYWLTFVTVISAFVAGVIGFVSFWVNFLIIDIGVSPALFNGYIAWLGGASAVLGSTLGSHSHMMVMALIVGVVAIVARRFHVLALDGWKHRMAQVGLWISVTGVLAFTTVFVLESFTTVFPNGTPPLLLASNPGGPLVLFSGTAANGMASDDTTMLWAAVGAIVVLVPLLFTTIRGRAAWRDPVRGAILATWILSFLATPIEGFYIEFHEATLSGAPTDVVFGQLQYFALVGITLICMALLLVDYYVDVRGTRTPIAALAVFSVLIATVGGFLYAFYTTDTGSPGYWVFNAGFLLMDLFILVAMAVVYVGRCDKIADAEVSTAPTTPRAAAPVEPVAAVKGPT